MIARASHVAMLILLSTLGLPGCIAFPAGGGSSDRAEASLPRLGEIQSRVTPSEPPEVDESASTTRRVSATIQQLELPLHTNVNESWTLASERVLTEQAREVWNRNGVRVGLLSVAEADEFFEAVPYVLNVRQARLITGSHPSALRTSPALHEPVRMDLTGVAEASEDEAVVALEGGRMRLLIDTTPNSAGGVTVTLLPHHQVRRPTLQPRDPLEKEMDGRLFEELAVSFAMDRDDVLVLGLYWPWPEETDESSEEPNTEAADGASLAAMNDNEPEHRWEPGAERGPALASHFGRAVFASRRSGDALQRIMLVHVEPTGGGDAATAQRRTRSPQTSTD